MLIAAVLHIQGGSEVKMKIKGFCVYGKQYSTVVPHYFNYTVVCRHALNDNYACSVSVCH